MNFDKTLINPEEFFMEKGPVFISGPKLIKVKIKPFQLLLSLS